MEGECLFAEPAVAKGTRNYETGNFLVMKFSAILQVLTKMYDKKNSNCNNNNKKNRIRILKKSNAQCNYHSLTDALSVPDQWPLVIFPLILKIEHDRQDCLAVCKETCQFFQAKTGAEG